MLRRDDVTPVEVPAGAVTEPEANLTTFRAVLFSLSISEGTRDFRS